MAENVAGSVSLTPGSKAFSALKTEIARYAKLPDDPEALGVAADGIFRALNKLNQRMWYFNRKASDITFTTNQKEYDIPADYMSVTFLELLNSTPEPVGRLDYLDPTAFEYAYTDRSATSGTPLNFTLFNPAANKKLTLSANPASAWTTSYPTGRFRYFATFAYPSLATDIISSVSAVELFVTWEAKRFIAMHYLNNDKIEIAAGEAADAYKMLTIFDNESTWRAGAK